MGNEGCPRVSGTLINGIVQGYGCPHFMICIWVPLDLSH